MRCVILQEEAWSVRHCMISGVSQAHIVTESFQKCNNATENLATAFFLAPTDTYTNSNPPLRPITCKNALCYSKTDTFMVFHREPLFYNNAVTVREYIQKE